ncbi:MAG: co-chaperone GroES [Patescibacteria group bacterium]
MKLEPLGDRLIVEAIVETSKSGFVVPETMDKEKPQRGKIIAAGPGKVSDDGKRIPMHVKVGDIIVFRKYAPDEFKIDGETFLILSESDVIALVK